eukprot:g1840.t1
MSSSPSFKSSKLLTSKEKRRTLLCLGIAQALDHADSALMPACLKALEEDLHISPSSLGLFALAQTFCGALSAPVWGRLTDVGNRIRMMTVGMYLWSCCVVLIGMSSNFIIIMGARALNGVALTCLNPLTCSLAADLFVTGNRGRAFGALMAVASIGHMVGSVMSTTVSREDIFGIKGWRVAFGIVGLLSALGARFVSSYAVDPPRGAVDGDFTAALNLSSSSRVKINSSVKDRDSSASHRQKNGVLSKRDASVVSWKDAIRFIFRIRTFALITFQGMWGSVPWNAFQFMTMWLQYSGFTDHTAALVGTSFTIGHLFGAFAGGIIGDAAARRYPDHGRVLVAQFSDFARLPLIVVLFRVLPVYECGAAYYALVLFFTGFLSPWVSIAANRPILCELVPSNLRGQLFAYQRLIEQISAATLGAPLVGWLSESVFGYQKDIAVRRPAWSDALKPSTMVIAVLLMVLSFEKVTMINMIYLCLIFVGFLFPEFIYDRVPVLRFCLEYTMFMTVLRYLVGISLMIDSSWDCRDIEKDETTTFDSDSY